MPETFVLIAGAWHGGWAYRPLAQRLRAAGHRVLSPTLPGLADGDDPRNHSLADVVDFVVDLIERQDLTDVTLVGHSWGGFLITGAYHRLVSRLRKLIYWSAFVPAEGANLLDEAPPALVEYFRSLALASGNNTVALPLDVWQAAFIQDAPEPAQRLLHELLVPQPMQYFSETVRPIEPASLAIPVGYVVGTDDIALPPGEFGWTPRFPQRLGLTAIEVPGSHEACFTRPDELAQALLHA